MNNAIGDGECGFFAGEPLRSKGKCRHTSKCPCIDCKKTIYAGVIFMKDYIEERAVEIAYYIIEHKATVRQTAKEFGVSKSTIHAVVTI